MRFSYRVHESGGEMILAISDAAIVGRTLRSESVEITVSREFYHENVCDENKAAELAEKATIVNAMGSDIVKLLASKGFITSERILMIGDVPHAQIITIR